jgi:Holliday junction resolvase RusA-like endonuclease
MDIRLTVEIEPKGKKSPQTMRTKQGVMLHGVKNKETRSYEGMLRTLILSKLPPMKMLEGPVMLHFLSVARRPKTVPKDVRDYHKAHGLPCGPENRLWCPRTPDIDNIRKSIQDALKPRWTDDKLVVVGVSLKAYGAVGESPKIIIRLSDELPAVHFMASLYGLTDVARIAPPVNGDSHQSDLFDSHAGA